MQVFVVVLFENSEQGKSTLLQYKLNFMIPDLQT